MDVSSVSSSINSALAASLQSPARTRAAEQDQQAQQQLPQAQLAQPSPPVQGADQVQQSSSSVERQAQAQTIAENNRPTVNLNGQTVGTRVNTTA